MLEQAGFPVSGLLATHGDWDHLLGRLAFPGARSACAESTAARLRAEPGAAQRELRDFDEEHYVEGRAPLALSAYQALPVPGKLRDRPTQELELHPADGHTADGIAFLAPWLGVLVCGDYLSPVEIPMDLCGRLAHRLPRHPGATARARPESPDRGPGPRRARSRPGGRSRSSNEDAAYLDALAHEGARAPLPEGRRTAAQRTIHERNAERATATPTTS